MKYVVGVDTNSFWLACAIHDGKTTEFQAIGKGKKKYELGRLAGERIPKLCEAFWRFLQDYGDAHDIEVWVEDYAFVGGSRSTAEIAQCVGAVKDACQLAGVPCYTLPNTTWKLDVVGKGNSSKEETKDFLIRHNYAPPDLDPPDLYDACGVLMAGLKRGSIVG